MHLNSPHILGALACTVAFAGFGATQNADAALTASFGGTTLFISGDDQPDALSLALKPGDPNRLNIDFGSDGTIELSPARSLFSSIQIATGGGDDTVIISDSGGTFTDTEPTTINGGAGIDSIAGGGGPETILGGRDADIAHGGGGDDTFVWNPGDGSDVLNGKDGSDTLQFNGANVSEKIAINPQGAAVHLTRDVANISQDFLGIELVNLPTLGGNDTITAGDLAGRTKLKIDAGFGNDTVVGSDGNDVIAGGGDGDVLHGRTGNDTILGQDGDDQLFGDAGHDALDGGAGADQIACGDATDLVAIDPLDTIADDCFPAPAPAPTPPPPPPPPADPGTPPPPSDPGSPPPPTDPGTPPTPPAPPLPPVRGFAKPVVKPTRTGLLVKLHSTSTTPITVKLVAVESKRHYKTVTKKLAPGARVKVKLKAPPALRKRIAAHRHHRRPKLTVKNVANGLKLTLRPRL